MFRFNAGMTDEEYWAQFKGEKGDRERKRYEWMLTWLGNEVNVNKEAVVENVDKSAGHTEAHTEANSETIRELTSPPKAAKILK